MENNAIDTAAEENLAEKATSSMEDGFVRSLATIHKNLKYSKNLKKSMKQIEETILDLFNAKLFTIFQSVDNGKEIVASFMGGIGSEKGQDIEIRVPFTPTSLAGYVALSQRPILVKDVYYSAALEDIHPRLQ